MSTAVCDVTARTALWSPADTLSPRVWRLHDEYWDFYNRDYTNEVRAFTSGTPWDQVHAPWNWTNVPEMMMFFTGAKAYLLADATQVELPPGFWDEPLVVRRAVFSRRVLEEYLPVQILAGELVVGSHFSTALSRTLTRSEARRFTRMEKRFMREVKRLSGLGAGNCGAVPGHLIPDYPRVLQHGWRAIQEEADAVARDPTSTRDQRDLARAISICADGVRALAGRYADEAGRLAVKESDAGRRAELEEIARACRKVPWEPAGTFTEALQSLWFAHLGPTAVIRSVGHLGLETAPNGASHTMSFSPGLLRSPENRHKLAALLRAYGQAGGTCLQVNVVSPETLRAAQKDPDVYRNLLVRVIGYNAYFVMLGKEIQDEIIARESHAL